VSGSKELDAYAVLGVDPASDDETVAAAYRALARRLHPDVAGDGATHQMSVVNAAFDRVRDPKRRREYDDELQEIDPARAARARSRPRGGRVRTRSAAAPPQQPKEPEHHRAPSPYHEFDDSSGRDGTGGAGRPPGRPSGSVLTFGRHLGWSIGEIARVDPGYLVWLEERREGRPYLDEIDGVLRRIGYREDQVPTPKKRR
jgi:curved DNA-binding protein CbpA